MLSIQEELVSLDGTAGLPLLDNFIGVLQKCKRKQNLAFAKRAHEHACFHGMEAHALLGNYLVPMFVDCGSLPDAQQIFNRLAYGNDHSWTSLIQGYMECGEFQYASILYHKMQEISASPRRLSLIVLLNACARFKCLELGGILHNEIDAGGYQEDLRVGSALVNMYAKCGSLVNAFEVFDKLAIRDVVAWTALIAGYAEHGHGEKVLSCMGQMQLEGISSDPITLVCGLKACACIGSIYKGWGIHADIVKKGFEGDSFIGNSLVDMYSKCGSLVEAQEVFNRLPLRTSVSWNALITGYADHQFSQKALACFQQMQAEGFCPDTATFLCILKACSSLAAVEEGREIHIQIFMKGCEGNLFVGSALVDMYAKCGLLAEAHKVLDELPARSTVSWNALIAGYAEYGLGKEALSCVRQMQLDSVSPDAVTYTFSLKACGSTGDIDMLQEIHYKVEAEGYLRDPFVGSTLVDMYVKCGSLAKAQEVFDMLPVRRVVAWTALMTGYAEHGFGQEALICFQQMQTEGIPPNAITFMCILKGSGSIGAIEIGREMHSEIAKKGLEIDLLVGNSLIDMYIKCGSLAEAQEVFDKIPIRNVVSWTTLIAGYAEGGHGKEALHCFEQMQLQGVFPDAVTFFSSLNACSTIGMIDKGQEIHAEIAKEGLECELFVGSSLVDMYTKCGLLLEALEVFETLPVRDVVVWTALIAGFSEKGFGEEAWKFFQQMQLDGVSPDVVSWNAVISGYAGQGEIGKALKLYAQMQEQGLAPVSMIFTSILKASGNSAALVTGKKMHALIYKSAPGATEKGLLISVIEMYCKCGSSLHAQKVFDEMVTKDVAAWNALLTGYAHLGESENVLHLFERAREGLCPDELTFLSVLNACCHAGFVDKGLKYFKEMSKVHGMNLIYEHYNCMVDLLGRAGHLNEAITMVDKMPFQPDVVTWSIVLSACQKWGDVELGRQAFDSAVRLNGNRAAAFVTMSNLYADVGMCNVADN